MGEAKNKDKLKCPECNSELQAGAKFCAECGKPLPQNESSNKMKSVCPKCYAEFGAEVEFCANCGIPVEKMAAKSQKTTCPRCYSEIEPGLRYCSVCGSEINITSDGEAVCPHCGKEIPPGMRYCTECGTSTTSRITKKISSLSISSKLKKRRETNRTPNKTNPETLDTAIESGKELMKGLGGLLEKTGDKNQETSETSTNRDINNQETIGYLVCYECGGYYQLQPGESPDDFSDECECGGMIILTKNSPEKFD